MEKGPARHSGGAGGGEGGATAGATSGVGAVSAGVASTGRLRGARAEGLAARSALIVIQRPVSGFRRM